MRFASSGERRTPRTPKFITCFLSRRHTLRDGDNAPKSPVIPVCYMGYRDSPNLWPLAVSFIAEIRKHSYWLRKQVPEGA